MDRRTDDTILLARTAEGEAWLVGRIAAGDRRAFEALYRAYFPRLTRFLYRMTRSAALIEEIVNDTLLAVWRKASTFDGSSKVSTWIFAIAYRRACSALRSVDNQADRPFDDPDDTRIDEREAPDADRPDWQFERRRLTEAIDAGLLHPLGGYEEAPGEPAPHDSVDARAALVYDVGDWTLQAGVQAGSHAYLADVARARALTIGASLHF
jgi:RNA polymerase sigma-70 factor (ECF subfamily)